MSEVKRQRKQFLGISTLILCALAVGAVSYTLFLSLKPSARARAELSSLSHYKVSDLNVGGEKIVPIRWSPYFIRRTGKDNFLVLDLQSQFSNGTVGCAVDKIANPESHWYKAAFVEPCRGAYYDREGHVLKGSHPDALPLQRPEWDFDGVYIHIHI